MCSGDFYNISECEIWLTGKKKHCIRFFQTKISQARCLFGKYLNEEHELTNRKTIFTTVHNVEERQMSQQIITINIWKLHQFRAGDGEQKP